MSFASISVSTALVLAAVTGAPDLIALAQLSVANTELAQLDEIQVISKSTDDLYAPSLDSLTNDQFGRTANFHDGAEVAYTVNESRTHFVGATLLPSGGVVVRSDESPAIECAEYTGACVSQVTSDAALIAAIPVWVTF